MEENKKTLSFGWSGFRWLAVTMLLVDYILVSQGLVDPRGFVYNGLNGLGSLLMIANSLSLKPKDWAVAVFNMVWVAVAIVTILRIS